MKFSDSEKKLSPKKIAKIEADLGVNLPKILVEYYLRYNGGVPNPYVFQQGSIDTSVSEFLSLTSIEGDTSPAVYKDLVLEKKIVPVQFYPFAIDGGGDYFFLDMNDPKETVYLYIHDTVRKKPFINLRMSFTEFWDYLKEDD